MKINTGNNSPSRDHFMNNSESDSNPDIIEQVDKVINKYKNQLEQLKPKKDFVEEDIEYYPSSNRKKYKYSELINNNSERYIYNNSKHLKNNNKYLNTETDYTYEENNNNYPNKIKYYFKYRANRLNKHKKNLYKPVNKSHNLSYDLNYEIEDDNIKLGSALTLEKTKVAELSNLLKIKENEISNLKKRIDDFEAKVNEIENKYKNIVNSIGQKHSVKLYNYNNISDENNELNVDYREIKRNSEKQLDEINNELNNNKRIIKIFFNLFNKNIDLFNKTEIISGIKSPFITENNYTEENALLVAQTIDKLINKLVQDNKDLYNELLRLKGQIDNSNIILGQNNDYIKQENNSLRQLIHNLTIENDFLKKNKKNFNIQTVPKKSNTLLTDNTNNYSNNRDLNNNHHHQIVHSICRHCTSDCFKNSSIDVSPFEKLKVKINNLEKQIKCQTYS